MSEHDGFNLYRVTLSSDIFDGNGWDTYSAMIVAAKTKQKALSVHPDGYLISHTPKYIKTWAYKPEHRTSLEITLLGKADHGLIATEKLSRENFVRNETDKEKWPSDIFVIANVFCPG